MHLMTVLDIRSSPVQSLLSLLLYIFLHTHVVLRYILLVFFVLLKVSVTPS